MLYMYVTYICMLHIYNQVMHIYIYISIRYYVSTELHLWLNFWVSLAALSLNLLGKYPFFN